MVMIRGIREWTDDPRQRMVDLQEANHVEVLKDHTGKLWINVDGVCVVRIGSVIEVEVKKT